MMNQYHIRKIEDYPTVVFSVQELTPEWKKFVAKWNVHYIVGKPIEASAVEPYFERFKLGE